MKGGAWAKALRRNLGTSSHARKGSRAKLADWKHCASMYRTCSVQSPGTNEPLSMPRSYSPHQPSTREERSLGRSWQAPTISSPSDWHSARLSGRFGLFADLAGAEGGGDGGGVEPPQATATITEQHNGVVVRFTALQDIT
jgi:hypothetical protein